jgi:hypothetical protein
MQVPYKLYITRPLRARQEIKVADLPRNPGRFAEQSSRHALG